MDDGDRGRAGDRTDPPLNPTPGFWDHYEPVYQDTPGGYDGSCLRPRGRCEMGGCCDLCWHSPDHPRHAGREPGAGRP